MLLQIEVDDHERITIQEAFGLASSDATVQVGMRDPGVSNVTSDLQSHSSSRVSGNRRRF